MWDPLDGVWVPTSIECTPFPSQTWEHLIWNFERVGNQVHYVNLSSAGEPYHVDQYFMAQANRNQEEIDATFQLEGHYEMEPYNVWLDEITLNVSQDQSCFRGKKNNELCSRDSRGRLTPHGISGGG